MTAAAAPVAGIDPFSLAFMRDPYPLVRLERDDSWAVARYEQVNALRSFGPIPLRLS